MKAKAIAFYLPQFHPTPENDAWWGPGFTEWTNVAKARALFKGHEQPNIPADLGFYDLRLSETRKNQAKLAQEHGIYGFCYWHYWFAGKRILDRPFNEVLSSGKPDFPFCLGWANHTWSRVWQGKEQEILIEQTYPGLDDHKNHFQTLLGAFKDDRYIKVNNKPLFLIFDPTHLKNSKETIEFWKELAVSSGLEGLYVVGILEDILYVDNSKWNYKENGFDAITVSNQTAIAWTNKNKNNIKNRIKKIIHKLPILRDKPLHIYQYKDALSYFFPSAPEIDDIYPCIVPNWDNTPRHGPRGVVLKNPHPELFRLQVKEAIKRVADKQDDEKLIFIKSWNEWAEGNHLEPNEKYGKQYLEVLMKELIE